MFAKSSATITETEEIYVAQKEKYSIILDALYNNTHKHLL
jgi:hypothetical protein